MPSSSSSSASSSSSSSSLSSLSFAVVLGVGSLSSYSSNSSSSATPNISILAVNDDEGGGADDCSSSIHSHGGRKAGVRTEFGTACMVGGVKDLRLRGPAGQTDFLRGLPPTTTM